jgi:hypothetical protein
MGTTGWMAATLSVSSGLADHPGCALFLPVTVTAVRCHNFFHLTPMRGNITGPAYLASLF